MNVFRPPDFRSFRAFLLIFCLICLTSCGSKQPTNDIPQNDHQSTTITTQIQQLLTVLESQFKTLSAKINQNTEQIIQLERSNAFLKGLFLSGITISLLIGVYLGTRTRKAAENSQEVTMN
ncbi:MAG: hypothetical protein P9L94_02635, partial [Candidatus Hinthialibacter antarcticus]|nr:hypothetical protein [Candidatus Hinthialibacter antarcticus]